jgi:hypothetical protein
VSGPPAGPTSACSIRTTPPAATPAGGVEATSSSRYATTDKRSPLALSIAQQRHRRDSPSRGENPAINTLRTADATRSPSAVRSARRPAADAPFWRYPHGATARRSGADDLCPRSGAFRVFAEHARWADRYRHRIAPPAGADQIADASPPAREPSLRAQCGARWSQSRRADPRSWRRRLGHRLSARSGRQPR